jgi:hypothetical protein
VIGKAKSPKTKRRKTPKVESVPLPKQKRHRCSKHHLLMREVLKKLETLGEGSAIKIQLINVTAKTMRSAVFRAASAQGFRVTSFSDQHHLYVLKQKAASPDTSAE